MNVETQFNKDNNTLVITLSGEFDRKDISAFLSSYEQFSPEDVSSYEVDMREISHVDSMILGMFLMMDSFVNDKKKIKILNCSPDVFRIFEISNFSRLFTISSIS